ncbi:hypothetical protein PI124_g17078 [Phytophthora idaei]|nr:hypothetical protein PI126_g17321 [Phytophthora idaei]KAG3237945.1 hypothetical protein PI124_g17078 [Phytophthora idaei]
MELFRMMCALKLLFSPSRRETDTIFESGAFIFFREGFDLADFFLTVDLEIDGWFGESFSAFAGGLSSGGF